MLPPASDSEETSMPATSMPATSMPAPSMPALSKHAMRQVDILQRMLDWYDGHLK